MHTHTGGTHRFLKAAGNPPLTEIRVPLPWYFYPSNVDSKAAKELPK